jgi:hypothetical protein
MAIDRHPATTPAEIVRWVGGQAKRRYGADQLDIDIEAVRLPPSQVNATWFPSGEKWRSARFPDRW